MRGVEKVWRESILKYEPTYEHSSLSPEVLWTLVQPSLDSAQRPL